MESIPSVSVSIVSYNSDLDQLKQTIENISAELSAITPHGCQSKIVLVDNKSRKAYRDNLREYIEGFNKENTNGPTIHLALQSENRGFGYGHNLAARLCTSDLHLIANPDILIHPGSLSCAINEFRKDNNLSMVLPVIYDVNGNQQFLHSKAPGLLDIALRSIAPQTLKNIFKKRLNNLVDVRTNQRILHEEKIVFSGCLMLVNRKDFLSIGGFDEKYFLYFEDYDLSLRITKGKAAKICEDFKTDHFGGNTHKKSLQHKLAFIKSYIRFSLMNNQLINLIRKK